MLNWISISIAFSLALVFGALTDADEFSDIALRKLPDLLSSLPDDEATFLSYAGLAAQLERAGKANDAHPFWDKAVELVKTPEDEEFQKLKWAMLAGYKIRAGDLDGVQAVLKNISDERMQSVASGQIAFAYCEMSKFDEAVNAAEEIDNRSVLRFNIMETISRASAKSGNFRVAARASRGMDPYGEEYAIRKMRWMCELTQLLWRAKKVDEATRSVKEMSVFKILVENDPMTMARCKLDEAAFKNENLESELSDALKIGNDKISEKDLPDFHRSVANTLIAYDRTEVIDKALEELEDDKFIQMLHTELANHYADLGNQQLVEKHLSAVTNVQNHGRFYLALANSNYDQKKLDDAQRQLRRALELIIGGDKSAPIVDLAQEDDFQDLLRGMVKLGQVGQAFELVDRIQDGQLRFVVIINLLESHPLTK